MNGEEEEIVVWDLRQGTQLLATIKVLEQDFPWNYGRICPTAAFENFRHYFGPQPNPGSAKAVREQLSQQQVTLAPHDGAPVREFGLIVEGEEARFQFV